MAENTIPEINVSLIWDGTTSRVSWRITWVFVWPPPISTKWNGLEVLVHGLVAAEGGAAAWVTKRAGRAQWHGGTITGPTYHLIDRHNRTKSQTTAPARP